MNPMINRTLDFIDNADQLFVSLVETVTWDERMSSRKTASFGKAYNYSGMTYPEIAMTKELDFVAKKIGGSTGWVPNNCLINFYPDGESTMGFHSDATDILQPETGVAIVSLGAEREIVFREKSTDLEVSYPLPSGSLLVMGQDVQHEWKHAIPAADCGARISLTFRSLE